ncbi:extracellular solute-binding protein [Kangiella marina]|uniref:Extracellular solute-binding protein n=1 Tax=Kangiella marina TaxID=1079178 RepID=A0ABP8INJ4_9GAMM
MKNISFLGILCAIALPAMGQTTLFDPSIKHQPKDNVVKLYGAGGPHTAFRKVAEVWEKETGTKVEIIAGPESRWSAKAQADADVLWGTSEQSMTAFLETYKTFDHQKVTPIYIRPTIIAVKKGNPKNIKGFDALLVEGMKIVVTEGKGVYNTSGTGTWEDVAGRAGSLTDIALFRKNIISYSLGSGASFKAFKELEADAWITWPNWPISHPDELELVPLGAERTIWRDVNVVISPGADPEAQKFLDFLITERAQKIMATEGWQR